MSLQDAAAGSFTDGPVVLYLGRYVPLPGPTQTPEPQKSAGRLVDLTETTDTSFTSLDSAQDENTPCQASIFPLTVYSHSSPVRPPGDQLCVFTSADLGSVSISCHVPQPGAASFTDSSEINPSGDDVFADGTCDGPVDASPHGAFKDSRDV